MTDGMKRKTVSANRGSPRSRIVVIGSSTGGPQALQTVITGLSEHFPCPVVVVQHIAGGVYKRSGKSSAQRGARERTRGAGRRAA